LVVVVEAVEVVVVVVVAAAAAIVTLLVAVSFVVVLVVVVVVVVVVVLGVVELVAVCAAGITGPINPGVVGINFEADAYCRCSSDSKRIAVVLFPDLLFRIAMTSPGFPKSAGQSDSTRHRPAGMSYDSVCPETNQASKEIWRNGERMGKGEEDSVRSIWRGRCEELIGRNGYPLQKDNPTLTNSIKCKKRQAFLSAHHRIRHD
jgi:hypothetical protein